MKRTTYRGAQSPAVRTEVVVEVVVVRIDQFTRRFHRTIREQGIQQKDVAKRMGITRGRLSQIIFADKITLDNFKALNQALVVTEEHWSTPIPVKLGIEDGHALIRERVVARLAKLRKRPLKKKE